MIAIICSYTLNPKREYRTLALNVWSHTDYVDLHVECGYYDTGMNIVIGLNTRL